MKTIKEFIIENLIFEYIRNIETEDFSIEIGNHVDDRKLRGTATNFKINLTTITDNKIKQILTKFKSAILSKINSNILTVGDFTKSIQLINYDITIALALSSINVDGKYVLSIKSIWPTDDDYGNYQSKYKKQKEHKDNTKIFIDELK